MNKGITGAKSDGDRMKELEAFDDTKAGVKGLVDAGTLTIPKIFMLPPEKLADNLQSSETNAQVPVIDLSNIQEGDRRKEIVEEVREASESWGFFQVVNHGIPVNVLERMIDGVRLFHEQDVEEKKKFYTRDNTRPVRFNSNFDLFQSQFASWRDSLAVVVVRSDHLDPEELPAICRDQMSEYLRHIIPLGDTLFELLSEALGLGADYMGSSGYAAAYNLVSHYYPACPNPELTLGLDRHSDPGTLTLLLQNQISGLQVLHEGQWVNVDPIPGRIVVNIGDLLQIISNDKLKSGEHRVLANRVGPRISVPCFFSGRTSSSAKPYKPIEELISEDNPAHYKEIVLSEYISNFYCRKLDGKSNLDYYRL